MATRRAWVAAASPGQALLAPLCVAVGSSYAHYDAQPGPGLIAHLIVTLGAFAAGIGVNLIDHAWERMEAPPPDPKSPVPEHLAPLDPVESATVGAMAVGVAALCGLGLVPFSGAAAVGYGALAVILGAARGIPTVGLDALGWSLSEIVTVLALGPAAASAGFASQAGHGSWGAVLAGIPAGIVALAPSFAGRFPRLPGRDLRHGMIAIPLLATAAILIAVRAGEYGPVAYAGAAPMAVIAALALRLPAEPGAVQDPARLRWATVCALITLVLIVAALRIATPE